MQQVDLKIERVPVDELVPYAGNAKLHPDRQIEQIANSMREFNVCDPIAVWTNRDGDLEIVEGHGRVMALERLGIDTAPVIRLDHLSDEARRAYTHVHNQTTLSSGFDVELLEADLSQLDYDWEGFGFEGIGNAREDANFDDVQEEPVPVATARRTSLGEVWRMGDHVLLCGDATNSEDVKRLIEAGGGFGGHAADGPAV